jgi:two-component system, chemotaxis family, protein-glutamate methylesterase/glutaminase
MSKLSVLIADDSVLYRGKIRSALGGIPWLEVVGVASNGRLAVERLQQKPVDLLILDLEMPEMDGLQTLAAIKQLNIKCKVIVFSSSSKRGAVTTLEALSLGATEFVAKPGAEDGASNSDKLLDPEKRIESLLRPKIAALFPGFEPASGTEVIRKKNEPGFSNTTWELLQPGAIVIGSSTGGPTVLETLFSSIAGPIRCPILVTQHMPPIFTATLAERIQKMSGIPTYEATDGQVVENAIYIAPGNFHMTLQRSDSIVKIALDQGPLQNSVRPAVDPLFVSAAQAYGSKCLGFVLTGMGADGKVGSEKIKAAGGSIIIQEESTCVVFGMPGAVQASGAYDCAMSPQQIIDVLIDKVANKGARYAA